MGTLLLAALLSAVGPIPGDENRGMVVVERMRIRAVILEVGNIVYRAPSRPGTKYRIDRNYPFKVTLSVRLSRVLENPCPPESPCTVAAELSVRSSDGTMSGHQTYRVTDAVMEPGATHSYAVGPFSIPEHIPVDLIGPTVLSWKFYRAGSTGNDTFFAFAMTFVFREGVAQ